MEKIITFQMDKKSITKHEMKVRSMKKGDISHHLSYAAPICITGDKNSGSKGKEALEQN